LLSPHCQWQDTKISRETSGSSKSRWQFDEPTELKHTKIEQLLRTSRASWRQIQVANSTKRKSGGSGRAPEFGVRGGIGVMDELTTFVEPNPALM